MKMLMQLITGLSFNLTLYPIAEGEEEYRVKREILSNIRDRDSRTALASKGGRGSLREKLELTDA